MLVDPNSKAGKPNPLRHGGGRRGDSEPVLGSSPHAKLLAYLIVVAAIGAGAYRLFVGPFGPASAPGTAEKVQPLIRSGDRITVPEHSPVRAKLAIEPVSKRTSSATWFSRRSWRPIRHAYQGAPPLAGRVTQLKVAARRTGEGGPAAGRDRLARSRRGLFRLRPRQGAAGARAQEPRPPARTWRRSAARPRRICSRRKPTTSPPRSELQRATARLKQIGVDAETTNKSRTVTVVAPMAGSVIDLGVAPGEYWNDTTAALMTVADLSTVWVTASVPEKDTALVSKGQSVDVGFAAYPGEVFKGQVLFVSDVLDPDTRRTKVRIAFDNPDTRLRPGMFANVSFYAPMQRRAGRADKRVVAEGRRQSGVRRNGAVDVSKPRNVDIGFQQGDQVVLSERRQGRRSHRRQGRSAAR